MSDVVINSALVANTFGLGVFIGFVFGVIITFSFTRLWNDTSND